MGMSRIITKYSDFNRNGLELKKNKKSDVAINEKWYHTLAAAVAAFIGTSASGQDVKGMFDGGDEMDMQVIQDTYDDANWKELTETLPKSNYQMFSLIKASDKGKPFIRGIMNWKVMNDYADDVRLVLETSKDSSRYIITLVAKDNHSNVNQIIEKAQKYLSKKGVRDKSLEVNNNYDKDYYSVLEAGASFEIDVDKAKEIVTHLLGMMKSIDPKAFPGIEKK